MAEVVNQLVMAPRAVDERAMGLEEAAPTACSLAAGARARAHAQAARAFALAHAAAAATRARTGLLFGISWLLFIDGVAFANAEYGRHVSGAHYIPGLMQTLSLAMLNTVNWESVSGEDSLADDGAGRLGKAWVFVAFCCGFGGLIGSSWILVQELASPAWPAGSGEPAVKGFFQNVLCFGASLLFRASRTKADA